MNIYVAVAYFYVEVKDPVIFTIYTYTKLCLRYNAKSLDHDMLAIMTSLKLTDNTRKSLLGFKGYMTKSNTRFFATVLCLIPENVYGRRKKNTGHGLAAGRQLFYCKIYGFVLQCRRSFAVKFFLMF